MSGDSVRIVSDLYEAFNQGDLDRIRPVIAPDCVTVQAPGLPWGGHYEGPEGFFAFLATMVGQIETALEVEQVYEAGGTVVQIGYAVGTVRATGRPFRSREVHTLLLRDGLVVSFTAYVEVAVIRAALGLDAVEAMRA